MQQPGAREWAILDLSRENHRLRINQAITNWTTALFSQEDKLQRKQKKKSFEGTINSAIGKRHGAS